MSEANFERIAQALVTPTRKLQTVDSDLVIDDYESLRGQVRQRYVDLINRWGVSSGRVWEERGYPQSRFSTIHIESQRRCPYIHLGSGNQSIGIGLESDKHEDIDVYMLGWKAKPEVYDPHKLTTIFSDDGIILRFSYNKMTRTRHNGLSMSYHVMPDRLFVFRSSSGNRKLEEKVKVTTRDVNVTTDMLQGLISLVPFLEAQYQLLTPALPEPEPEIPANPSRFPLIGRFFPRR